jgi:hypothetical protein
MVHKHAQEAFSRTLTLCSIEVAFLRNNHLFLLGMSSFLPNSMNIPSQTSNISIDVEKHRNIYKHVETYKRIYTMFSQSFQEYIYINDIYYRIEI